MERADRETEPGARGETVVRSAAAAINEAERRLCGAGAVSRPAVAEGLAHRGRRAATLLAPPTAGQLGSPTASTRVPWVHHRNGSGVTSGFAFELAASVTQDAVDHCLVAHELARRIGAAGLCTLAPPPAGSVDRVTLPDTDVVHELDARRGGTGEPAGLSNESILAEAAQAFQFVAGLTGRPVAPVTVDGPEGAELGLVVSGVSNAAARRFARELESQGVGCRVVCIHLLRPFPAASFARAVADIPRLLFVPGDDGFLEAGRRAAIAGGLTAIPVLRDRLESPDAIDAARDVLGLEKRPASRTVETGREPVVLTARPAGAWAEAFLLDVALRISAEQEDVELTFDRDALTLGRPEPPERDRAARVALCAHPSYLESTTILLHLDDGATLVIVANGPLPDGWWQELEPETRALVLELGLRVHWLDLSGCTGLDLTDPDAVRSAMVDAYHSAGAHELGDSAERRSDQTPAAAATIRVDVAALESERESRAPGLPARSRSRPDMPVGPEEDDDRWRDAARAFHLTALGAHSSAEPTSAEPLHPLVLDALDPPASRNLTYPLLVDPGVDPDEPVTRPFNEWAKGALAQLEAEGQHSEFVGQHLERLSAAAGKVLSRVPDPTDPAAVLAQVGREFEQGFDLSDAGRATLHEEIERVRGKLGEISPESRLIDLNEHTPAYVHVASVRQVRRERRERLVEEIETLCRGLEELISIDDGHSPEGLSAETVGSSLGSHAAELLDSERLAEKLRRRRGPQRLGDLRRQRIESALETLREGLAGDAETDVILVRPDPCPGLAGAPGVRELLHPRGLGAAIGVFDGLAVGFTDLFRAIRIARLEVDGAYDPDLHDEPLARLGWQGLHEDELLALPRLVVLETDARLRGAGLGALSELIRSGRPVHVLVEQTTSDFRLAESWQGLSGFHPGLGYLAIAHREAFVVQSSLVCPARLARGLKRMAHSLRPGVALVSVPAWNASVPAWIQLQAAEQARAMPGFVYDPEAGPNWAERFELEGNPQPDRSWPVYAVDYLDAQGEKVSLEQPFSFAHAVALDPAYRGHFRIVPVEAWSTEQLELADYLAAPPASVTRKIPFIWVVREGQLARALITRELAYACRDRLGAWRILQELAGTDNEYARRAAETARI
ncbi:MAG: hypothetical protein GTO30_08910, partial [Acidobacteria bacterium]|nr:hypothetical protein [Acidobacteriota bacterium]NIN71351.1 hypothetical protein [Gemmatimonadota bacterium]NIP64337.1 hypothetical protein [Gammaproteobacteria bacterium]NIQ85794.1 hypothetical protein [Acidobacteriota bacterium]